MAEIPILNLLVGQLSPLGQRCVPSGIAKYPIQVPLSVHATGLEGDAQGDTDKHGGPEKAVHHYPLEHYAVWKRILEDHPLLTAPGAFGENVATLGLTEENVAIGDVFSFGSAILQVSQGRQPCWRLNERFGIKTIARQVQQTGKTGWYYRVLETGTVSPSDRLRLIDRPSPAWTIRRIWKTFYIDPMNKDELEGIVQLEDLAVSWRDYAARRLHSGLVEDWDRRLNGR